MSKSYLTINRFMFIFIPFFEIGYSVWNCFEVCLDVIPAFWETESWSDMVPDFWRFDGFFSSAICLPSSFLRSVPSSTKSMFLFSNNYRKASSTLLCWVQTCFMRCLRSLCRVCSGTLKCSSFSKLGRFEYLLACSAETTESMPSLDE